MLLVAPAAHADTASTTTRDASAATIPEIIVTARKREESVERIPEAVTAVTTQLQTAAVRDITDIDAFVPNVRIDQYPQRGDAPDITIRGISPSRLDDNSIDSPIGVVVDGIYLGTLSGQLTDNFDLQRIEVLRGPQGTLFGRNTIGGALNVVRTEPTGQWGAKLQYTTGSWNDQEFRAVLNAPLVRDVLALKLYFFNQTNNGYLYNSFLNSRQPKREYRNYGLALRYTPNNKFKGLLLLDKYDDFSEGGAFLTNYNVGANVLAPPRTPSDINAPGTALAGAGVSNTALLDTYLPALIPTLAALGGATGVSSLPNVPARTNLALPNTITDNYPAPGNVQTWAATLNMNYQIADNLNIFSVTGYRRQNENESEDFDGSSTNFINILTQARYQQFSQELRLEGDWDTRVGKIDGVLGLYYFGNNFTRRWETTGDFWTFVSDISGYDLRDNLWLGPIFGGTAATAAATGYPDPISACLAPRDLTPVASGATPTQAQARGIVFGRVQCDQGGPKGGVAGAGGYGAGLVNILYESQRTDSVAGFAHVDWQFYPSLTLTAGVRYTWERKHFVGYQSYIAPLSRINDNDFPGNANLSNAWTQATPTAALSWQVTPDVMFYTSYAQGWHSGGFFGVNQNSADFLNNQYKPETSDSYELGMKGQFFEHRVQLNLAGFVTTFNNKQESSIQFDKTTNTVVTVFTNVGGLEYKGLEGELEWAVSHHMHLSANFGYLDARYTKLLVGYPSNQVGPVPIIDASKLLVPRNAPKWTLGAEGDYTAPVGPGDLTFEAQASWVDKVQGDLYNASQFIIPSHANVSATISYSYNNYKFSVFGRNLTNWRYETPVFISPLFASGTIGPGASWGAELSAKF